MTSSTVLPEDLTPAAGIATPAQRRAIACQDHTPGFRDKVGQN